MLRIAHCRPRCLPLFILMTAVIMTPVDPALARQILQISGDSLTSVKYASATGGQDVRPRFDQRGVGIDGSLRAGSVYGLALAGNPFGEGVVNGGRLGDVNLATGTYNPTFVFMALPAPGRSGWVVGTSWNFGQEVGGVRTDSDGYNGTNQFHLAQPEIALYDADSNPATLQAGDIVYVVYGADRYIEFVRQNDDDIDFRAVNGAGGVVTYLAGTPDRYVYTDQRGTTTTFFGFDTTGGHADGQFWRTSGRQHTRTTCADGRSWWRTRSRRTRS